MSEGDVTAAIEAFVRRTFAVAPDDPRFTRETDLFEGGYVDSVGLVELLAFVEDEFEITVPEDALMSDEFASIDGIARVLDGLSKG